MEVHNNIFYILLSYLPAVLYLLVGIAGIVCASQLSSRYRRAKRFCFFGSVLLLTGCILNLLFSLLNRGNFKIFQFLNVVIYSMWGHAIFFSVTSILMVSGMGMIIAAVLVNREPGDITPPPVNP